LCAARCAHFVAHNRPPHTMPLTKALCLKRSYICTCMKTKPEDFKIYEHERMLHLSIGEDYSYSATGVLTYARQNPDINVLAKKSWILTDDYQAEFVCKNCVFVLFASFDNICVSPYDSNVPSEIASELYGYLKSYVNPSLFSRVTTLFKCFILPFTYNPK